MLNRPHIEFIQAQALDWQPAPSGLGWPGATMKQLSRDDATGGCSIVLRLPAGLDHQATEHWDAWAELYVLEGQLTIDGQGFDADSYACFPPGATRQHVSSAGGCVLIAFFSAEPVAIAGAGTVDPADAARAVPYIDASTMAWDLTLNDPNLKHLGIGRKNLRTDPVTGERTFLSIILPHANPPENKGPQERHPIVEEAYVLFGTTTGPQGTMHPGAYFWRPPMIGHGPYGSRTGSVSLIRFVGGKHVNIWSPESYPYNDRAPYDPVLPDALKIHAKAIEPIGLY
jgi:hypothetical protein